MNTTLTPGDALSQIAALAKQGLDYTPPPPPIDVAAWWIPKPGKSTRATFVRLLPDGRMAITYIKNPAGWPWDIDTVDGNGIYFRVTERADTINNIAVGWPPQGDPRYFRLYSNPFQIAPRYYDASQGRIKIADVQDVPTLWYSPIGDPVEHHLGPAQSYFSLQKAVSFGGDLGVQDSLVSEFYYTIADKTKPLGPGNFKSREEFFATQNSGWVRWRLSALQTDGSYKIMQDTNRNSFIPDNLQVPVFPCNVNL